MATTPIIVTLPAGRSGDKLELYPVEGTAIANGAGGDTLTALFAGSRLYKADVTEAITGDHQTVVKSSSGNVIGGGFVHNLLDDTTRQYVRDTLEARVTGGVARVPANVEEMQASVTDEIASSLEREDGPIHKISEAYADGGVLSESAKNDLNSSMVWSANVPAIEALAITIGAEVVRYRGTVWAFSVEGLLAIPSKVYMTVKRDDEPDAKSVLQLVKTTPSDPDDGLLVLNGSAPGDAAAGSIAFSSYDDDGTTKYKATATIDAETTAKVSRDRYRLDFKDAENNTVLGESVLKAINPVTLTAA